MPKTIQELATGTTKATNISSLQGEQWKQRVINYAESLRFFDQVAMVDRSLVGSGDKTVHIPKTDSSLSSTFDVSPSAGEGGVRDFTTLDNLTTVDISVGASQFQRGGVEISKQAVMTSTVDLLGQARFVIANALAHNVDTDLATAIENGTPSANKVLGGDASDVSALTSGDTMDPDLIATANKQIKANDFVPRWLFISPAQEEALLNSSQFTNAAEYGSREPILRGEIGQYLGLRVISTNNTPSYSSGTTDTHNSSKAWNVDGTACPVVGTKRDGTPASVALVWKEDPQISSEFVMNEAVHRIYYDQAYNTGTIHGDTMSLIKVAD